MRFAFSCFTLFVFALLCSTGEGLSLPAAGDTTPRRRTARSARNPSGWSVSSVTAYLWNNSTQPLYLKSCEMAEGIFDTFPNKTTAVGWTDNFSSESDGDGSTKGACSWGIGLTGEVLLIAWDDPMLGENSYQIVINPGTYFTVSYTGGTGYHTTINVLVNTWGRENMTQT